MIDDPAHRRLVARLAALLTPAKVTDCAGGDPDARTARNPTGRSIGRPAAWVRPANVHELVAVVRAATHEGLPVVAVGEASTYWDALRVDGAVAVDTRALRDPPPETSVDVARRTARVGAGVTVRELDRVARSHGLSLEARPDNGGDSSLGSLVAIGCAAGLGMGRALPIELVTGATVVTGDAQALALGASHALAGRAYMRHGLPDLLGLFTAAEGRGAIVADVSVRLVPAAFEATAHLRGPRTTGVSRELLRAFLRASRETLDGGGIDTLRFEAMASGSTPEVDHTMTLRTYDPARSERALERARAITERFCAAGFTLVSLDAATEACRRGLGPDYDAHGFMPEGHHRASLSGGGAFWGADVMTSWGDELDASIDTLTSLFARSSALDPRERRLGLYPGHHALSVGFQALGDPDPRRVEELRALILVELPGLLRAGAVPYRPGHLWREALAQHLAERGESATAAALGAALAPFDPRSLLGR